MLGKETQTPSPSPDPISAEEQLLCSGVTKMECTQKQIGLRQAQGEVMAQSR
jgi:hypothetical protein